ncbi:MAG: acyl carrier protein [Alphaproteobacteria bacterium]|jgi:acyl carrier protein|nr:acyl carrier protein [Alphaproteobacteria bacterium]
MAPAPGLDTIAATDAADSDEPVARTIFAIVANERKLDPAKLTLDSRLEDLDIESVDLVEIIFAIEDEFDIDIPQDKDDFKLETMRDIVDGVRGLIAARDAQTS